MLSETGYIALGSNQGDRRASIHRAVHCFAQLGLDVIANSALYESPPMYVTDQPAFLNAAVAVNTSLDPNEALNRLLELERTLGRVRHFRFGPRTIDLDILLWGEQGSVVVRSDNLVVPHPRLHERPFALIPLAEIAPEATHPDLEVTIAELARTADHSTLRRLEGDWI